LHKKKFVKTKEQQQSITFLAKDNDKNNTTTNKQIGDKRPTPTNNKLLHYTLEVVGLYNNNTSLSSFVFLQGMMIARNETTFNQKKE
jgi:hypothetical protein